jgi:perosamine synthetase
MIPIAKPIIGDEEIEAVVAVLRSGMIVQGAKVKELEEKFAQLCGVKHAVAVSNGTAALHTALHCAGVGEGDEVITTPFTFVATANAILMCGATPVFADIGEDFLLNPVEVERKITEKTKAILPVDLYGMPADYDTLQVLAERHGLKIIADACQSVNASYRGKKVGGLADVSCFSLYATKNIMCGEGGMITTDDDEVAEQARRFRHHGQQTYGKYSYIELGYNYRMTDIAAALALVQLGKINEITEKRQQNALLLSVGLEGVAGIVLPRVVKSLSHTFHQFTLRCEKRDELAAHLKQQGVGCKVFYPAALHVEPHLKKLGYKKGDFPVAEKACNDVLSIPVHPLVSEKDVEKIVSAVRLFSSSS